MSFLNKEGLEHLWQHIVLKLGDKVDVIEGKGLSTNDYTDEEKNKLADIDVGANKTVVDDEFSTTSENPVQNKVINAAISTLSALVGDADTLDGKHAEEFALASDVETLQTQVGDSSVSEQIDAALQEFSSSIVPEGSIIIDSELSDTSINPVQNKVVTEAINQINSVLDTTYWRATEESGIYSDSDLVDLIQHPSWINNQICRLQFASDGDFGGGANLEFTGHDVIGIPYGEQGLYVIDMTTGKSYTWEVTNGWTGWTDNLLDSITIPDAVTDAGVFSTLDELKSYTFEKGKLYKFGLVDDLRESTTAVTSKCLGIYDYETGPGGYLTFINLYSSRCGEIQINTGTYTEYGGSGGVDKTDHVTLTDRVTGTNYILYVSNGKLTLEESEA